MTRVLVPLAEGFEDLEAVTITDILRRGGLEVVTAGLETGAVTGARGTRILPDCQLDEVLEQSFDLLALPGGQPGTRHLQADPRIRKLLLDRQQQGEFVAAVCAAPGILAELGLLSGKRATSFPGVIDPMRADLQYTEDSVVVDGNIVTSRGPGTALDFALTLVELLQGPEKRHEVEKALIRPSQGQSDLMR